MYHLHLPCTFFDITKQEASYERTSNMKIVFVALGISILGFALGDETGIGEIPTKHPFQVSQ